MRRIAVGAAAVFAVVLAGASVALATPNTKIDLFQECAPNEVGCVDMAGPTGFGFVNFNQDSAGALRVVVSMKAVSPKSTYHVFLVCGPTHSLVCGAGFVDIGTLVTNGHGNGNSGALSVSVATLQALGAAAPSRITSTSWQESVTTAPARTR